MNKLSALSKLAGAYHYLHSLPTVDTAATAELLDSFGYIRRSLRIDDLKPTPKDTEGWNPKGPVHF